MLNHKVKVTTRQISAAEFISRKNARYNPPAMSERERAARHYLAQKRADKEQRVENYFLATWAALLVGAVCAPLLLVWGL